MVVDGRVQLWTRAGPTAVGQEAFRVTVHVVWWLRQITDYVGFVKHAAMHESTAACVRVYQQEKPQKAFEGNVHRVVLLAVRFHGSGEYWAVGSIGSIGYM